jgi:hypothetical protein
MITLTRRQARRLRGVFRRHVLGIAHRREIAPLVLRADGTQVCAEYRYDGLAVTHVESGRCQAVEAIALPLESLADFEGRDDSPVIVEAVAADRTVVRYDDHGIPQVREYAGHPLDTLSVIPELPASWSTCSPDLLDALAEATATACDESARYALNCVALRGSGGEVVGTDGRQILILGGFRLPWSGEVLVNRSPIYGCKSLPRDEPILIGKTETHVVLRAGPWTLFLEIKSDVRYPAVERALPAAITATTRLRLAAEDATFLGQALDRLPGADELNAPATVDLNGRIAIRAKAPDQEGATELLLSRSRYTGAPVTFNTNRDFLSRAIRLGFREIGIADPDSPIVCRDGNRAYAWQPLTKDSAIEPSVDVTRIESGSSVPHQAIRRDEPPKARTPLSERTRPTKNDPSVNGAANDHATTENTGATGLVALIQEAEALHEQLADAKGRTARLIVALRRHRKRERLVASTLATLKELRLQDVAE